MIKPILTYEDACTYLDDLQMHKIKLGLDSIRSTLGALGSPELKCPAVHVAGTNGKGSVCATLRSITTGAGYKTGLYTSPHLSSVRERFRIDDEYISKEDFTRVMETIRASLGGCKITYFECTTVLAFLWFAENECDLMILETGMGGRLDATNVVTPLISVITSISMDHEQYLGNNIAEVAFEKAGIIKQSIPVISGVDDPEARAVIERTCREKDAPLIKKDHDFRLVQDSGDSWSWESDTDSLRLKHIPPGYRNSWQMDNVSCAVGAALGLRSVGYDISEQHIDHGIGSTTWPGRLEYIRTTLRFLLDGAHNQAGVDYLIQILKQYEYRRLFVIWASMADKSYQTMLRDIAALADVLLLSRPDSDRAAAPEELRHQLGHICAKDLQCCNSVEQAFLEVHKQANEDDLVVVAGSLYLIGEFRKMLVGEVVG